MSKHLTYFLVIASCALVCCSEKPSEEPTAELPQPILKIAVAADGTITLDGNVISLENLREELAAAVGTDPVVWLYRAESEGDPPEESSQVLLAIREKMIPISTSSEPDYSTIVSRDGSVRPRK